MPMLHDDDPPALVWSAVGLAVALAVLAWALSMQGCCTTHYRYDGSRYYRADECPWGGRVVCDSATRLPDPATWTEGCR